MVWPRRANAHRPELKICYLGLSWPAHMILIRVLIVVMVTRAIVEYNWPRGPRWDPVLEAYRICIAFASYLLMFVDSFTEEEVCVNQAKDWLPIILKLGLVLARFGFDILFIERVLQVYVPPPRGFEALASATTPASGICRISFCSSSSTSTTTTNNNSSSRSIISSCTSTGSCTSTSTSTSTITSTSTSNNNNNNNNNNNSISGWKVNCLYLSRWWINCLPFISLAGIFFMRLWRLLLCQSMEHQLNTSYGQLLFNSTYCLLDGPVVAPSTELVAVVERPVNIVCSILMVVGIILNISLRKHNMTTDRLDRHGLTIIVIAVAEFMILQDESNITWNIILWIASDLFLSGLAILEANMPEPEEEALDELDHEFESDVDNYLYRVFGMLPPTRYLESPAPSSKADQAENGERANDSSESQ